MKRINPSVELRDEDGIAVILVDNPPVNALKHEVRAGLGEGLRLARDSGAKAAVVACAGRTFLAGADITEFGKPSQPPSLLDVLDDIEAMPIPTVAALHGTPLGGGFELALTCHFRVAAPGTRVGLPEIKLGLIPGAGGTQRLPRLVGPDKALRMILSGEPIPAAEALADGILDEIVDGDLLPGAIAFARRVVAEQRPLRLVRDRGDKLAAVDPKDFLNRAEALIKRSRGQLAPAAAVQAVHDSLTQPFDEGMRRELATFRQLLGGDQSKAQRHIFFSEREAAKVPDLPASVTPREVRRAVVIGAGTMGGGIAMCFANSGIPVTVVETAADALQSGLDRVAANYKTTVARGTLAAADMDRRMSLISGTLDLGAAADADVVIEAAFEDMAIKKTIFGELDRLAGPDAVLATNTSTLDVNEIAGVTRRPESIVGMHFFSPANVMRLLEVVRATATTGPVLATAIALGRKLKKVPVVVGVCDGFVGNRMLARRSQEAERLLLEGASPREIDDAVMSFGFPMGPCAMSDLVGLDVGWRVRQARGARAFAADALYEAGRLGQKNGRGYYRYEAGARAPLPDPEAERLIAEAAAAAGIQRRNSPIPAAEITERMIFPVINEGARILDEGIARRPGDIDVIWVYGYGWPAWRGGPMFHADLVGLEAVCDRLEHYARQSDNPSLGPAPLLSRLRREGGSFAGLVARGSAA
ncbi:MAG TPA: 3-hydroxyacyl-CoA dehydrogenase NAD-binding domain-containing protein [Alphaproteobacteria bacterium]